MLSTAGITMNFGKKVLFENVSLKFTPGNCYGLIGANGTGKSTLLRCCLGLILPDAGQVALLGSDLARLSGPRRRQLRARTGLVGQKHNLVPRLSVLSNVLHGAQAQRPGPRTWFHSLARASDRTYALHCLELVGLADLADRRADRLSGGQSQRVAIARALMQRPRALFADEPAGNLDSKSGNEIKKLLIDLNKEGKTIIMVTHEPDDASIAKRLVIFKDGEIVDDSKIKSAKAIENKTEEES